MALLRLGKLESSSVPDHVDLWSDNRRRSGRFADIKKLAGASKRIEYSGVGFISHWKTFCSSTMDIVSLSKVAVDDGIQPIPNGFRILAWRQEAAPIEHLATKDRADVGIEDP
jgi:hypothetical protein